MNIQHYLNERVEGQINYYERKGSLNKTYYLRFKVAQMIAAALLPFMSVFITDYEWTKYIVAFLGTLVTILEGVLAIGKYHEKWINYRATAEALQQEKFIYLMHAGPYTGREAGVAFVNRIELILGQENKGWQQMALTEPAKDDKNTNEWMEKGGFNKGTAAAASSEDVSNDEPVDNTVDNTTDESLNDPLTGATNDSEEQAELLGENDTVEQAEVPGESEISPEVDGGDSEETGERDEEVSGPLLSK